MAPRLGVRFVSKAVPPKPGLVLTHHAAARKISDGLCSSQIQGQSRCEPDTQEGQLGQGLGGLTEILFPAHLLHSANPRRMKVCKSFWVTEQQKYYRDNNYH